MKIAVIGCRGFQDYQKLRDFITAHFKLSLITCIVSGGAVGADTLAEQFAKENGLPTEVFLPDWKKHGKRAGLIRNKLIVEASDLVVAFWNFESSGTGFTVSYARKSRKKILICPVVC